MPDESMDKPMEQKAEPVEVRVVETKVKIVDEEKRRAEELAASPDAAKYTVTEATPSSGGVFPPSAVVAPFSPEVVAAHTPGEAAPEEAKAEPATT